MFVSTESTSSDEFTSQFGLAIFLYTKNTQKAIAKSGGLAHVSVERSRSIDRQRQNERRQQRS